jgi:redox-sensing transcriptional repressor
MRFLKIPEAVGRRLSVYARHLSSLEAPDGAVITSAELAEACGVYAAQVRKDLAYFGEFGVRGVGYEVQALRARIRTILGLNKTWRVALVGVGRLGEALLAYGGFRAQGYHFVAAFDAGPAKVGRPVGDGLEVLPVSELPRVVAERAVELAVLAVPAAAAQAVADRLVAAGVRGVLNFAPVHLAVPARVVVQPVDLTQALDGLAYLMATRHR